jgi:hypothetical protein
MKKVNPGRGAVEGPIFGLLGLILAFRFSGALAHFNARRHLGLSTPKSRE